MRTVRELADAMVASGLHFPVQGDWDDPLSSYRAGEYQLTVVDGFEFAVENDVAVADEFIDAATELIINRDDADPDDVDALTEAISRLRPGSVVRGARR
ncbi:hypothetical protein G4X40_20200 [Rhodococcus sp. D2-41]|uniref:hypothetical protein n=1 Tax=Speluncibacter jeojiensis TaxID=2710754 RepID=UPI002410A020|nr:hypothetical protein [Rhodococcus sp. D2-41]MDG3012465.1 hypothetical protein [Rhodococcus sp. D2-41]